MNGKTISTKINSETAYRLGILASRSGLTLPQMLREVAIGRDNFLRKFGGVHR